MNNNDILQFHTSNISPRLKYINHIVFELILGLSVKYSLDLGQFEDINGPKVNYTLLKIHNSVNISPSHLLFEDNIQAQKPPYGHIGETIVLYPNNDSDLHFDPLAACFYVVSRYEEYTNFHKDEHQRFPAEASIQHNLAILHLPIVQIWAEMIKKALKSEFKNLHFKNLGFSFLPTFDIDMAWSYKEKGLFRTIGASIKSIFKLDLQTLQERWQVNSGKKQDPFDTFEYIATQTEKYHLSSLYFFLVGRHSQYDKNTSPKNQNFIKLIQRVASKYQVGLHPSYFSKKYLSEEINTLQDIIDSPLRLSRQHYVRLFLPSTYRQLMDHQIFADYSMGYPDKLGFRNGLAIPIPWYDLEKEEQTALIIHPFQIMDVTLKNYLQKKPKQATEQIQSIIDTIRKHGGTCISIWHNSSFDHQWKGWKKVFEEMLSYAEKSNTI